jgi:hydrogenase expression/formation protein HypE
MTTNERPSDDRITHAHGAGGPRMRSLVEDLVGTRFGGDGADVGLDALDDGAVLPMGDDAVVVTTDSHVVTPMFFRGGDIGALSVAGTVNDLAVMGATEPLALTCSLVVEEGLEMGVLERVLDSMRETCEAADCEIHTGDTKVMGSGEIDGLAINTTGVAHVPGDGHVPDAGLRPGDKLLVTGTVGDHGIALLSEREGFDFEGDLASDVAPVNGLVRTAMDAGEVTAMKDPTRGGLATTLNEMVDKGGVGALVDERSIPVKGSVASAGEVLGIDPYSVANEGKVVMGVAPDDAEDVLAALRDHPIGEDAAVVGEATEDNAGRVVLDTGLGRRYLSEPEGQQLPRIC